MGLRAPRVGPSSLDACSRDMNERLPLISTWHSTPRPRGWLSCREFHSSMTGSILHAVLLLNWVSSMTSLRAVNAALAGQSIRTQTKKPWMRAPAPLRSLLCMHEADTMTSAAAGPSICRLRQAAVALYRVTTLLISEHAKRRLSTRIMPYHIKPDHSMRVVRRRASCCNFIAILFSLLIPIVGNA